MNPSIAATGTGFERSSARRLPTIRVILPIILVAAGPVFAADRPEPARPDSVAMTVPPVEVTALRGHDLVREIPAATHVLTRESLFDAGAGRLSTALSSLPGFHGYAQTGGGEASVVDPRGFTANGESSYLKLLVNGQDVRDVENGNVDWDWLLSDDVERVEVVAGSGAWLYGDGAQGGIINVVRSGAARDGLHSDCAARLGSFGMRTGSLALSGRKDPWDGTLRGGLRQADGWRDRSAEAAYTGGTDLAWRLSSRTRVGLDATVMDSRRDDPGTLTRDEMNADRTRSETQTDYAHTRRAVLGAHLVHTPSAREEWRLAPYARLEKSDQVQTIFFVPEAHPTSALTAGTEVTWRRSLGAASRPWTLNAGGQFERSRLTSSYEGYADGALETRTIGHRTTASLFGSARIALGATTTARLGVRGDAIRVGPVASFGAPPAAARTLRAASPFVALSRTFGSGGMVYGSFSTGFRVPTLHQLFDARPFFNPEANDIIFISNAGLAPQRSTGFEAGGRWDRPDGSWTTLGVYSTRVRDEIDFDLARFAYANLGSSWHRGVELGASQGLGRGMAVTMSAAWTPTTIVGGENDGRQINAVPRGGAYGAVRWSPTPRASLEVGARYVGRQYLDKANQHALPDFATGEVAVSSRVARLHSTLRVANVFDRDYADTGFIGALGEERFMPAAGRTFSLAVSFE